MIAVEENTKKTIEEAIREDGVYVSTTSGVSMRPLFKHRRDTVIISRVEGRLKKYDVPLYRRGDQYILHRIVKVLPDSYVIVGDNCIAREYDIKDENIIGVLTAFYRKNRYYTVSHPLYRAYTVIWCATYHPRVFVKRALSFGKRTLKKIFGIKK